MKDRVYTFHIRGRLLRLAGIVVATVLIVAPVSVWAADRFSDVPAGSIFHGDIAAIADAGVTVGCNPPANTLYCPKDLVTREQMAAFMNRLGALGPGKTPVVNADKIDGMEASDLVRAFGALDDGSIDDFTSASFTPVLTDSVTAPTDGFLFIVASIGAEDDLSLPGSAVLRLRLAVDGTPVHDAQGAWAMELDFGTTPGLGTSSHTAVVPVNGGDHLVALEAQEFGSGTFITGRSISTLFVPFGEGVTIPASVPVGGEHPNQR